MKLNEDHYDFEIILPSFFFTDEGILQGVEEYRKSIDKTEIICRNLPDLNSGNWLEKDKEKIRVFFSIVINTETNLVKTLQIIAENSMKDKWVLQYLNETQKDSDEIFRAQVLKKMGVDRDSRTLIQIVRKNKNVLKVVLESARQVNQ